MNRQIWTAVLTIVALLLVASALEAPDRWKEAGQLAAALAVQGGGAAAEFATAHRDELLFASLGAGLASLLGLALVRPRPGTRRRRGEKGHGVPWKQVVEMAQRGSSVETIARSTHLAQDAVKTLLRPIEREDPETFRDNAIRHDQPAMQPAPPAGRRRGYH
jgi:hypothetical protein